MGDMTAASRGDRESKGRWRWTAGCHKGGCSDPAHREDPQGQRAEERRGQERKGGEGRGGGRVPLTVNALASGVKIRLVLCMALSQSSTMIYAPELFFEKTEARRRERE